MEFEANFGEFWKRLTLEALDEEWKDVWEKISDEGIQIATIKQIILHFLPDISSHCRSRIEI